MFNHTNDKAILKPTHKATVRVPEQNTFGIVLLTAFKKLFLNFKFSNEM